MRDNPSRSSQEPELYIAPSSRHDRRAYYAANPVDRPEVEAGTTRLPAASLRARFASLLDNRGLDRQGLDMQRLLALFETFSGANSIFLPDAGREG